MFRCVGGALRLFLLAGITAGSSLAQTTLPNPILFVTQVPQPADFTTITAVFGGHRADMYTAPRGGDLWIRYPAGGLKNLTKAAGYGQNGPQHTNGIAVRDPAVHWDGTKAVFSMAVGAPNQQYQVKQMYWQLYEITGFLNSNDTPVITKVANQPTNYNNITPCYGTDGRIIFVSDRPRDGSAHLHPQLDEYESAATTTGLWSLDPTTGDLFLMNHSPSGVFSPSIDSFGRVVFIRWDHLIRDQQADQDGTNGAAYGTFNYTSEATNALILTNNRTEYFPESRYADGITNAHNFNHFFPWQINEDGTDEETLNHIGRHEMGLSYRNAMFNNDPNIIDLYYFGNKPNTNTLNSFINIRESMFREGLFFGIDCPEFGSHAGGQIVSLEAHEQTNADFSTITYITHRDTSSTTETPSTNHTGLYRDPVPLSDGRIAAIHTAETRADQNIGTTAFPKSRYDYRLKMLAYTNGFYVPGQYLTPGISNAVTWWSPDVLTSYTGLLWELNPVEVLPRAVPARHETYFNDATKKVFEEESVDVQSFQSYMRERGIALIVGLNATTRDINDQQQPYNLQVPGGVQTLGAAGKIYDVSHLQLIQADLIRGYGMYNGQGTPRAGRRVLGQHMHDPTVNNPPTTGAPPSAVVLGSDGSFASFVPGRRAMSWQLTDSNGTAVVRERYWVTMQPGEIRTCGSCHGANRYVQNGQPAPTNAPAALRDLLRYWKRQSRYAMITSTQRGTTNSAVKLDISGAPYMTNVVEYSLGLTNWLPVATNITATNTLFTIDDRDATNHPHRNYRIRVP